MERLNPNSDEISMNHQSTYRKRKLNL